ncbi:vesicular glutamate transporter 2 [Nephila pilipes]|uniref:Vesicular glutamate transporter 2 n=1 Tax=Nephila pilipes TaxID=299642 RepID=A0A8X6NXD7_NEPPI|nr:vesicular glutamate transporter 2 [Nephila pilipes]
MSLSNSVKHKKSKKQRSKSESETDVDSIVDDEFERNSVLRFKHQRIEKEKIWNQSSIHPEKVEDKYNVVISNDLKKVEDNIPLLSVYIDSGFAVEVKSFRNVSVRNHDHFTGKLLGKACQGCNLNYKVTQFLPVIMHNLSGYDSHLILKEISSDLAKRMKIIPVNSQKYTDVVLLAEVFENFRALSMNYFELDPVHFYTTPSLTWSAGINTANVTLELLTDIDMYLMLESGIRGGMCLVSKRFSKANNKYLENFDEMSPSKYIISLDVNNLYGIAMAFYNVPESEFRFLDQNEIQEFDLMSVRSDSNVGYILEVNLYYPPELHSEHNSFPMAPHHEAITFDMLSPYQ